MIRQVHKKLRKGTKRNCKHCGKLTPSSETKQIFKGKRVVSFHICLVCGEPYEFKSFRQLFSKIHKGSIYTKDKGGYKKPSKVIVINRKGDSTGKTKGDC